MRTVLRGKRADLLAVVVLLLQAHGAVSSDLLY